MDSGNMKISYLELSQKIIELQSLRNSWGDPSSKNRPSVSGEGMAVSACEQVADQYEELFTAVCDLMDNTIGFFTKVKNSVETTDQNAAAAIKTP